MPAQPLLEDFGPAPSPAIAIRIPVRLIGAVVLGVVAVTMVSLASWSVDDPSLSYATDAPVQNWLGYPGAVIADICFQVFGLGILAVLVPPALWGWSLLRLRLPAKMGLRLIGWLAASPLACGILAFVAAPASWPLPTGLGGLVGAGFANLAALLLGEDPQPVTGILFAIILAAPTAALFWLAMGRGRSGASAPARAGKPAPAGARPSTADDDIEPERDSVLTVLIGGLVHLGFSARTAWRRARLSL
ncbi:DNA translocase FtsK 4TM domain-containing protein, partial [Devosia sp.]|uniref:DNA translocase FtsK 4TM domain-containing protein n=1 Tax=Devosia sp. TaxID=1871048 RepID=UPI002EDC0799